MVEERFDRMDARFDGIDGRLDGIADRLDGIAVRLDGIDGRLEKVDGRLDRMDDRFDKLDGRLDRLETGQADLRGEVDQLGRRMLVLHEELIDRLAAMTEAPAATKADISRLDARIDDVVDSRIVPLEVAVRTLNQERRPRGPRRG